MIQSSFSFDAPDLATFAREASSALAERFDGNLRSVIVFGPACLMDESIEADELTLLIVFEELDRATMSQLRPWLKNWLSSGCPMPLLFEEDRLLMSGESFALEILDMKESRLVLWGEDPIPGIEVKPTHLLQQIEHELKSELHRIRDAYLRRSSKLGELVETLTDSLARLRLLLRATLRLYRPVSPRRNTDVLRALRVHITFDSEIISVLQSLNNASKEGDWEQEFIHNTTLRYMDTIITLSDAVDAVKNRRQRMMVL